MPAWRDVVRSLTQPPPGHRADGRVLGLGLAAAMDRARENEVAEVEEFLRQHTEDDQQRAQR
ncbi:hypothetical protein [Goodfellowiella coeruleoviolacea]|uniref:Uncharacterized protein n=1 Tax=Goodfellowiella coeruleoviolacea TaxID=334858 RepID=A0AAE3GKW0_9PSEU|nr:hypothetical protein [Goodfellowiella coeruleoviolacea]MCP2169347.1 hypothetical protein [Goodfellowiella coeruleoviolacea]